MQIHDPPSFRHGRGGANGWLAYRAARIMTLLYLDLRLGCSSRDQGSYEWTVHCREALMCFWMGARLASQRQGISGCVPTWSGASESLNLFSSNDQMLNATNGSACRWSSMATIEPYRPSQMIALRPIAGLDRTRQEPPLRSVSLPA